MVSGLLAVAQGVGAQTAAEREEPAASVAPLVADRPDFTEAATTVGRGVLQIEFGYTFGRERDDGRSVDGHSLGEPLLRAGILTDRLELRVGAGPATERTSRDGITASDTGMEDLYLGFKLALREQDGVIPALAILPQVTIPTGSAGFSSDRTLPGANVAYGWDVTDNLGLAGSTQLNRAAGEPGESYAEWAQSVTLGASLGSRAGMYGEWFAFFPSRTEAAPTEHYFNTGLTLLASDDVQWDIRVGMGLNDPAEDVFVGTGLAVRIR